MIFRQSGSKQTLDLDGGEAIGLLKFRGKSEVTSKIGFRISGGQVIAYSRNGVGAELFIRGNAPEDVDYEFTLEGSALSQIKIDATDTVSITCGSKPKLSLTHIKETSPCVEFAIHNHFSQQLVMKDAWAVPMRPNFAGDYPYSIDLDWGTYSQLKDVVKYSGSFRIRQYTPRDGNDPFYVEFGQERSDGRARWFATFNPYVDDDEALQDQGRQVCSAARADNDADPAGGDDEGDD